MSDTSIQYKDLSVINNGIYETEEGSAYGSVSVDVFQGFTPDLLATNYKIPGDIEIGTTSVVNYAFQNQNRITNVSAPNVVTVGDNSFQNCTEMISFDAPNLTSIGVSGLSGCTKLTNLNSPKLTTINDRGLENCQNLVSANFSNVTSIRPYGLLNCKKLESIEMPRLWSFPSNSSGQFSGCSSLKRLSLPNLREIPNTWQLCSGCPNLEEVYTPNLVLDSNSGNFSGTALTNVVRPSYGMAYKNASAGNTTAYLNSSFQNCHKLKSIDLFTVYKIFTSAFINCELFDTLIIRNNCKLGNDIPLLEGGTAAFNGTPFASDGTGGTLYVPQRLISSYQSATNWSTLLGYENNQILPIEGSYYETHYGDGTLVPELVHVNFTAIPKREYNSSGTYTDNKGADYMASDYITTNGYRYWKVAVTGTLQSNGFLVQIFNENDFVKVLENTNILTAGKEIINGTERVMTKLILPQTCTSFRFSFNSVSPEIIEVYKMVDRQEA